MGLIRASVSHIALLPSFPSEKYSKPGFFPQDLMDFVSEYHNRASDGRPESRKTLGDARRRAASHLLASGWSFGESRPGVKYYASPAGKRYYSFIRACEAWKQVEEGGEGRGNGVRDEADGNLERCDGNPQPKNEPGEISRSRVRNSWEKVVLEGKLCPEVVAEYAIDLGKTKSLGDKLRKHLVAVGWRNEFKRDTIPRFRYRAPEGATFYSLRLVCSYLLKGLREEGPSREGHADDDNVSKKQSFKINAGSSPLAGGRNSRRGKEIKCQEGKKRPFLELLDPGDTSNDAHRELSSSQVLEETHTEVSSSEVLEETHGNGIKGLPAVENLKAENLPEAIREYVDYMNSSTLKGKQEALISNARRHLLFMGWTISMKARKKKTEVWYVSSKGKSFNSLYSACKVFLEDNAESTIARSDQYKNQIIASHGKLTDPAFEDSTSKNSESRFGLSTTLASDEVQEDAQVLSQCGPMLYSNLSKSGELGFVGTKRRRLSSSLSSRHFAPSHGKLLRHPLSHSDCRESIKKRVFKHPNGRGRELAKNFLPLALRSSKRPSEVVSSSSHHTHRTVLSLLIDNDVVLPRQKVFYACQRDRQPVKEGRITHAGIRCKCCHKLFTLTNFEVHAGSNSYRPAANIYLADGRSLLQCQAKMVQKSFPHVRLKSSQSNCESDSICSVCQDGGTLLLCDQCPSSFHPSCVGLEVIPDGSWLCSSCRCGICGLSDFNCDTKCFTEKTVLFCDQCEREYHVGCLREIRSQKLESCPAGEWFCSKTCSKIFCHLRRLLGKSHPSSTEGVSWTLLRSSNVFGYDDAETVAEYHSKLRIALEILHECFVTIIEPRSRSDLVADLIFNKESELRRLNFWGFYTMILERGDEMISAATFRVYGNKVAEMPLIGTRFQYRRQGMCRLLVNELEKLLSGLGVELFLLPAVPQVLETWTNSFRFSKMTSSDRSKLLDYTLLSFLDTTMCQKRLKTAKIEPIGKEKKLADGENNSLVQEEVECMNPVERLPPLSSIEACSFCS